MHNHFLILTFLVAGIVSSTGQGVDIQKTIDLAVAAKQTTVTIPAGEYHLSHLSGGGHLYFHGITGITVKAEGVKIICEKPVSAIVIDKCKDLTIYGLTIDYDPLTSTQGIAESVDPVAGTLTVKIDDGYPCNSDYGEQIQVFDSTTRLLKRDTWQLNGSAIETLPNRRLLVRTKAKGALRPIKPNDLIAMDRKAGHPSQGILIENSQHIVLENMTLHAAPSFGVLELRGEGGNEYRHLRITPGPKPDGATTERLRSVTDDGIHSICVKKGPLIENCLIERNGDDGIAIHGDYQLVLGTKNKTVRLALKRDGGLTVGDRLRFYNQDGSRAGEATILKIGQAQPASSDEMSFMKTMLWINILHIFYNVADVELDAEVPVEAGGRATAPSRCGNGFVIRNNTIRNHRARGILIKASDGIIEGNTIDNSSIAGIVLTPEFSWMESDFAANVKIVGNTVRNCGFDATHPATSGLGIISVSARGIKGEVAPAGGHRNILISNNTVQSCRGLRLVVTSARDVSILGNRFEDPVDPQANPSVEATSPIKIEKVENVTLENNLPPK